MRESRNRGSFCVPLTLYGFCVCVCVCSWNIRCKERKKFCLMVTESRCVVLMAVCDFQVVPVGIYKQPFLSVFLHKLQLLQSFFLWQLFSCSWLSLGWPPVNFFFTSLLRLHLFVGSKVCLIRPKSKSDPFFQGPWRLITQCSAECPFFRGYTDTLQISTDSSWGKQTV